MVERSTSSTSAMASQAEGSPSAPGDRRPPSRDIGNSSSNSGGRTTRRRRRKGARKQPVEPSCEAVELEDLGPSIGASSSSSTGGEGADRLFDTLRRLYSPPHSKEVGVYRLCREFLRFRPLENRLSEYRIARAELRLRLSETGDPDDDDDPLYFDSDFFFQNDSTAEEHPSLTRLSLLITGALKVCRLEDELFSGLQCKQLRVKSNLEPLLRQARALERVGLPSPELKRGEIPAINRLVDYTAELLTALICHSSPSSYWQQTGISVLARRIAALREIVKDSVLQHYHKALVPEDLSDSSDSSWFDWGTETEMDDEASPQNDDSQEYLAMMETDNAAADILELRRIQSGVDEAIEFMLSTLILQAGVGHSPPILDIDVITYDTGFEGFKALIYQDSLLQYYATSDLDILDTSHAAFKVVHSVAVTLRSRSPTPVQPRRPLQTRLQWRHHGDPPGSRCSVALYDMDTIVTVMHALSIAHPVFLKKWTRLRQLVAMTGSMFDDVAPPSTQSFLGRYRLSTEGCETRIPHKDAGHLSHDSLQRFFEYNIDSWLRKSLAVRAGSAVSVAIFFTFLHALGVLSGGIIWPLVCFFEIFGFLELIEKSPALMRAQRRTGKGVLEVRTRAMSRWVFDESTVTVKCELYVWTVITIACLLTAGGLAVGFSVGERIHGVDPSNLATYLWVVAAFFVSVCKSVRVKDWAWNDFLNRRVRCTSVSELHSVTGHPPQFILAKLLHEDSHQSVLKTRGPFNSVFRNRSSDTTGFSIDEPISYSTLLLSGLIMVKVMTAKGGALVCLDARRNTELEVIMHRSKPGVEYLVCEDIGRANQRRKVGKDREDDVRLRLTRTSGMRWKRVIGIYRPSNDEDVKFI